MTKRRNKKKALLVNIVALVLCLSMLLGTTMAWFTDTVTNSGNRVEAGKLKVKLLRHDGSEYRDVSKGTGDIFISDANVEDDYPEGTFNGILWEPNKTEIVYLAVENAENLALNYNIILNVTNANADSTQTAALEEVLSYAVISGLKASESTVGSWKDIQGLHGLFNVETGKVPEGEIVAAKNGALTADNTDYFALAVHMDENAGNEYQGTALNIDVKVVAKQMSYEADSFGKEYDANAPWTEQEEKFAVYFNEDFESYDVGDTPYNGFSDISCTGGNTMLIAEDGDGNKYWDIDRNTGPDCLFILPVTNGTSKMMLEFDLASDNYGQPSDEPAGQAWIHVRDKYDSGAKTLDLAMPFNTGDVYVDGWKDQLLASYSNGEWVSLAYAIDFDEQKFNVYVNGQLVAENRSFRTEVQNFQLLRVQMLGYNVNLKIDNIKVYEGTTIRDLPQVEESEPIIGSSIMPTYEDAVSKLTGNVALHVNGGSLFAEGQKSELDAPVQMEKGIESILVPQSVVSEGLGLEVALDAGTQKITIGDSIEMTIGEKTMVVGSESVDLAAAPQVVDGSLLLPLYGLAKDGLGKEVFWHDRGIMIISDEEVVLSETELLSVNNYMLYDHPSKEEILEKFDAGSKGVHPRVMVTQDTFDNIVEEYNAGGIMKEWGDEVIYMADFYLKQPLPTMNRLSSTDQELLLIPQGIKTRIEDLAVAYYITGKQEYVDRVYAELSNAASFSDWNTHHFLNTAEYMTAFAIGYDWLYNFYTDEQRKVIEEALYEKGILNSYEAYYGVGGANNTGWWAKETINWNLVCNGGSICGAVALLDVYPDVAADVISNALKGMDFALASYYPDGVWVEGIEYWGFGTEFAIRASAALNSCFGEDFNITKAKGFSTTAEMPIHINGYVYMNNYNDAGEGGLFESTNMFWLADRFNEPGVAKVRYALMEQEDIMPSGLDMIYCNTSQLEGDYTYPLDKHLTGNELVTMRTSWDDASGTFLSFHGGNAHENHGHVDTGTFVIDMLGERIASDLGAEDYNHPYYFSDYRYDMYRARPEGHNMVVINPDESTGINLASFAKVEKLESKAKGAYSVLDLDDVYEAYASSYKRGYMLGDDRRSAVVRDEFTLLGDNNNGYWFMHTKADIDIVDETTAILTKNNKKFLVRFATNLSDFELKQMAAEPLSTSPVIENQMDNTAQGYKKLALEFSGASGDVYIEMKVIPYDDPASDEPLTNLPIAQWSIPDGEMSTLPKADMIYANGEKIIVYNPAEQSYTLTVPAGQGVPVITADTASGVRYEVTPASDLSGTTVVKVVNGNNDRLYSYYYISFREINITVGDLPGVEGATRHAVKNILASENPQEANMDVNVLDGDLDTRWSAEGSGQWIVLDLGEVQTIDAFGLATFNGNQRTLSYSIDISDDGTSWENIHVGTTMLTNDVEVVRVADISDVEEVTARYVRLTGYGTSTGTWNSITEFATLYFE